jgi:hypothetical protein
MVASDKHAIIKAATPFLTTGRKKIARNFHKPEMRPTPATSEA